MKSNNDLLVIEEYDNLSTVKPEGKVNWGNQTERALNNFFVYSAKNTFPYIIRSLAAIKYAAAYVNRDAGILDQDIAEHIVDVAKEVMGGKWKEQFPLGVFQTGSGTSTNMNLNEVIANIASKRLGRKIHPNDHVNMSQSTNDTFPSAIHITALFCLKDLVKNLLTVEKQLAEKSKEFSDVIKTARTHLMDATPITLGQEFSGYAQQVKNSIRRLKEHSKYLYEIPLGGTATGTGINTPKNYRENAVKKLSEITSLQLRTPENCFESQSTKDAIVDFSGALRSVAVSLYKIANDLRLMASGPMTGLSEIELEALQPGSSIMPGKVNPVACEALCMACVQVMGNDYTMVFASTTSNFELNVMLPIIGKNLIEAIRILSGCVYYFGEKALKNIKANKSVCERYANSSLSLVTSLSPQIGYEKAAELAKKAMKEKMTILETALSDSSVVEKIGVENLKNLLNPRKLT